MTIYAFHCTKFYLQKKVHYQIPVNNLPNNMYRDEVCNVLKNNMNSYVDRYVQISQ